LLIGYLVAEGGILIALIACPVTKFGYPVLLLTVPVTKFGSEVLQICRPVAQSGVAPTICHIKLPPKVRMRRHGYRDHQGSPPHANLARPHRPKVSMIGQMVSSMGLSTQIGTNCTRQPADAGRLTLVRGGAHLA
jgi:hypothetical protein